MLLSPTPSGAVSPSSVPPIPQAHLGQELVAVAILRFEGVRDADDSKPEYFSTKRETAMTMSFSFDVLGLCPKGTDMGLRSRGKG